MYKFFVKFVLIVVILCISINFIWGIRNIIHMLNTEYVEVTGWHVSTEEVDDDDDDGVFDKDYRITYAYEYDGKTYTYNYELENAPDEEMLNTEIIEIDPNHPSNRKEEDMAPIILMLGSILLIGIFVGCCAYQSKKGKGRQV